MINWLWLAIVGKLGLGLALSAACIVGWWLIPPLPWLTERLRLGLLITGIVIGGFTLGYGKGVYDEHKSYKAKIERQINEAVSTGNEGRADAIRKLDADKLPDDWWRD